MKIKQQKQIKDFLIEEFWINKGNIVFSKQEEILNEIIKNVKGKSKNQRKTFIETILPRIALYKAMSKSDLANDEVYEHM